MPRAEHRVLTDNRCQHAEVGEPTFPSVAEVRRGVMSDWGLVSRASPVHTAARNCTRDGGGPFGFGDQVADPKPPRVAAVKSRGGERRGNAGTMIPAGKV